MTEDALTMIKIAICLFSIWFIYNAYFQPNKYGEREDFKGGLATVMGFILLPISFVIMGFGIWLVFQGLILIGFGVCCISGIINWGIPEFIKWVEGEND
tara:strand:+ start:360 stop:656 length:297 start_codon:yes stop_codon:yes gene_type:complete